MAKTFKKGQTVCFAHPFSGKKMRGKVHELATAKDSFKTKIVRVNVGGGKRIGIPRSKVRKC